LKLRFSAQADHDLDAIKSYIAQDNQAAAEKTVTRILQSILYLQDYPRLGRPGIVPDTRELGILGLPYKAVYRIEGDTILIVTIVHMSRMYP
jgi:toxin ParE1/3/4